MYTYPSKATLAAAKSAVRSATRGSTDRPLHVLLHRLNPVLPGWAMYFRYGVSKATFDYLRAFIWRRLVCWLRHKHPRATWKWLRRRYLPRVADGRRRRTVRSRKVAVTRYRFRGTSVASPWRQDAGAAA